MDKPRRHRGRFSGSGQGRDPERALELGRRLCRAGSTITESAAVSTTPPPLTVGAIIVVADAFFHRRPTTDDDETEPPTEQP